MLKYLLWLILLAISWPLALLALVAYRFDWLLLPFRLVGFVVGGALGSWSAIVTRLARVLAGGSSRESECPLLGVRASRTLGLVGLTQSVKLLGARAKHGASCGLR